MTMSEEKQTFLRLSRPVSATLFTHTTNPAVFDHDKAVHGRYRGLKLNEFDM